MPGTGFVSIADYIRANQGTLGREQGELLGDVNGQIDAAHAADAKALGEMPGLSDPTTAPDYADAVLKNLQAQQSAQALGSTSGISALLGQKYGENTDRANFDASLFGGGFGGDAAKRASGLMDYLNSYAPPAAAPGPQRTPEPRMPRTGPPQGTAQKLGTDGVGTADDGLGNKLGRKGGR